MCDICEGANQTIKYGTRGCTEESKISSANFKIGEYKNDGQNEGRRQAVQASVLLGDESSPKRYDDEEETSRKIS